MDKSDMVLEILIKMITTRSGDSLEDLVKQSIKAADKILEEGGE